jgi:7,8-dihydropterin-6-yl-methyl-4-(beta-D-ribofuranosyl)aminobenzene 5'-phosphate synthase
MWYKKYSSDFISDKKIANQRNERRFKEAKKFDFPEVDFLDIDIFLESKALPGYTADCGVSYKLTTNEGSLLMDLGFLYEREGVIGNALKQGFSMEDVDGVIITHNHWDHMGGYRNVNDNTVRLPKEYGNTKNKPCWVAQKTKGENLEMKFVERPQELMNGICSIGPLSRALFSLGCTEEQIIVVNIKNKGLVVITGCGHPTLEKIFKMLSYVTDIPIYAIVGGLHLPIKKSRITKDGIRLQFVIGHGLVPTKRLTKKDLYFNIAQVKERNVKKMLLSSHDTDDWAIKKFKKDSGAEVVSLYVGEHYSL